MQNSTPTTVGKTAASAVHFQLLGLLADGQQGGGAGPVA